MTSGDFAEPREAARGREGERGASLVEVLVVVALIGILTNVGCQGMVNQIRRARAVAIVWDSVIVRQSAYDDHSESGEFPRDVNRGIEPRELSPALDGKVRWVDTDPGVNSDWEN